MCFPEVTSGKRTFFPNGRLTVQSGKPRVDYPYRAPRRDSIGDAGGMVWVFEPLANVVHNAYADGAVPLWDPYQALGAPLAAGFSSAVADPFHAPLFVHPSQRVWTFVMLLRLLVGGVGCFALLRALGARPVAALVPAVGYLLSTAFVYWAGPPSASVECLAPWILLSIVALVRRPNGIRFAALAVMTACACLAGQPETLVVFAWLAAAWALYCWLREGRSWNALAHLAGAGAVGGMLAAPQLLLGAQYVRLAENAHGATLGGNRITFDRFKPFLLGDFAHGKQAGIAICMVALAAAGIAGRRVAGVKGTWFMVGVMAAWAVRSLDLPGQQIVGLLPGINTINVVRKGEFVFVLGGAVLAAAGVQALIRGSRPALYAAAATVALPLVLWPTGGAVHENVLPAFLLAVALAGCAWLVLRRPRFAPLLGVLFVLQFGALTPRSYARPYNPLSPRPFTRYVQQHLGLGERAIGVKSVLRPQIPQALRIPDPQTGDGLYPKRYASYMHGLVGARPAGFAGRILIGQSSSPFLAAIGVRYLLAPAVDGRPKGTYHRAFRDASDPTTRMTVWENEASYPRGWLPGAIQPVQDATEAKAALERGDGNLRARSLVEQPTPAMRNARGQGTVRVERIGWNDSRFHVVTDKPAVLVTSDQYYPGWEARIDGHITPIRPANVAMRAVAIPAGEHTVTFRYRPAGFRYGVLLAAVGLLLIAARLLVPVVIPRVTALSSRPK